MAPALTARQVYVRYCDVLGCKRNSALLKQLPDTPGAEDDIHELDLSMNFVGPKGLLPVLEVVKACRNLKILSLKDNQLTNQSVVDTCEVVVHHPSLQTLDFSDNPITLSSGKAILQLVTQNTHIQKVILDNTNIRPQVLTSIQVQCERNQTPLQSRPVYVRGPKGQFVPVEVHSDAAKEAAGILDAHVARQILTAAPHPISPLLLDVNPVDNLLVLCEQNRVKFEDPQFPPHGHSISPGIPGAYGVERWRRIGDLYPQPELFPAKHRLQIQDIAQGVMHSSCIVASLSEIFRNSQENNPLEDLFYPQQITPHGAYSVKLFVNGKWRYVVIDDFIPCIRGSPAFLHPVATHHVWVLLLEKALAKVHLCYEALDDLAQMTPEALECPLTPARMMGDLTAGVAMSRSLHHPEFDVEHWWDTLQESLAQHCMAVARCNAEGSEELCAKGLAPAAVYSVLGTRSVGPHRLLQLGCSWLDKEVRWNGDWSSSYRLWDLAENEELLRSVGGPPVPDDSTSFWISYLDFLQYFSSVSLCRKFPKQNSVAVEGRWTSETAGGAYFANSWGLNPHYEVQLSGPGTVFVQLTLPDIRFAPVHVDALGMHLVSSDYFPLRFEPEECVAKTPYVIADTVSFEAPLAQGTYWLVPSTYTVSQTSPFLLRFFSTAPLSVVQQPIGPYWKPRTLTSQWEQSGGYQEGDDHPQFHLVIPHLKGGSPTRASFAVKTSISMEVDPGQEYSIVLFVCAAETDERISGFIPDEMVVTKSKFLISNSVTLNTSLLPGRYTVVCCLQPEGASSKCKMEFWCTRNEFSVKEIPFWTKTMLTSKWVNSGVFQSAEGQPQFELQVPPDKPIRLLIKAVVDNCNDPALILFICDHTMDHGHRVSGPILDDNIVARSMYVRADSVSLEWAVTRPGCRYLIVPCLQPPGSRGTLQLSVASPSEGVLLNELVE